MSPRLALHLLGLPQLYLDDAPIPTERRKALALLAYLAIEKGQHTRESLSALLWPDYEQSKAFTNLRHTLWEIQQSIGDGWLDADRDKIGLNNDADIWLDVAHFKSLLEQSRVQTDISLRIALLVDSAKLYRNHFLAGFSLKDAHSFNEWAYVESDELRFNLSDALNALSEDYCVLDEADKAIAYARRLITLDPLNEASHRKLMDVYIQAGQHSAALKQYQTCEQILRKELNLDPQPETLALYKKIRKGEMKPTHVEKQIKAITPKNNLPSQLSSFVGREKEQAEIIDLITKHRLVTLVGIGGIGKTSLALQVGQKLLSETPNGIWFIALDSLSDPKLVPHAVASVFDIRETPGRPVIEILASVLREKTTLLILDNCEHLLDAGAQLITTLLQSCPNVKILATSREVLNVTGEAIYQLSSLSMPAQNETSLERLPEYESIGLFTERATLAFSSFALTKENAQAVMDICRKVEGIPLAIELAAARVNMLQVAEISNQLQSSFALLSTDHRNPLSRHQTLQASLDWSWGLLNEAEQIFMRQLAVFAGGWTLEAAQAVCAGDVLGLTGALVKKSFIGVKQAAGRTTRYLFHEIVRQYADEKFIKSGEEEYIRTRHLKYFLQLSAQFASEIEGPEQAMWHVRAFDEADNIRVTLQWADKTDVEAGLYLSGRLQWLWYNFDLREGTDWLSRFLQKPEAQVYSRARINALNTYGEIMINLQQFDIARSAAEEGIALSRTLGDQAEEVDGLVLLAFVSNATEGEKLNQQALEMAQALGDVKRQISALWGLGWSEKLNDSRKFESWKKAIALVRPLENWRMLASFLSTLGLYLVLDGEVESAQKYLDEADSLYKKLSLISDRSYLLSAYGQIALVRGDFEKARAYFQEVSRVGIEFGDRQNYLWGRTRLGYVAVREGNLTEARLLFHETARSFQQDKYEIGVTFTLEGMAGLYIATGKFEFAAQLIGWADATRNEINDPHPLLEQADVDRDIAAIMAKIGGTAFEVAYASGREMTMDEAVALALDTKHE